MSNIATLPMGDRTRARISAEGAAHRVSLGSTRYYVWFGVLGLLVGVARATRPVSDTDFLWSTRFGLSVFSGRFPTHDPYSWSAAGKPWIASSWGWNVVLGAAYRAGHLTSIWLIAVALSGLLGVVAARAFASIGAHTLAAAMSFTIFGTFALVTAPRAQAVGYLVIFAFLAACERLARGDRRTALRALGVLVMLQIIWVNLHSTAVLGPLFVLVAGSAALSAADTGRREGAVRVTAGVVLASTACLVTPYGWSMIRHVPEVRRASVGLISEWDHAGFGSIAQAVSLAVVVAGSAVAVVAWRAGRRHIAASLVLLCVLSWSAIRFAPMLGVVMMPEVALLVGRLKVRPVMLRRTLALGLAVVAVGTIAGLGHFGKADKQASTRLVAEIPSHAVLVNDYLAGNSVILYRPDVRVSVDGRNDMYGRTLVLKMIDLLRDAPGTQQTMNDANVNAVLAYSNAALVQRLEHDPRWRIVDSDSLRTLLVRTGTT